MMQDQETEMLRTLVTAVTPFTDPEWDAFAALWKPFSVKRKELLTVPGQRETYLYFVVSGIQRVYYFDDQHREATLVFTYAPSFGGVLDAFLSETASRYFYEALTPSTFLRTSYTELMQLATQVKAVDTLIRKGSAQAFSGVLERLAEVQCYSAEERFKKLFQRSPHILQLIPHKYLANYLGIDATNFSKLMNKVRI